MSCLPDKIFGRSIDDVFAFETPKVVRIHDRRLGFLYFTLVAGIAGFVVGYQMLYNNEHFQRRDVEGTARMTIQQPTVKGCNPNKPDCKSDFHSLNELPYCREYNGPKTSILPKHRQKCTHADQHTLAPTGMLEGNMLVPTRIDQMIEKRNCEPGAVSCDNEFVLDANPQIIYVADIERFTIMLSHSYKRDYLKGNNGQLPGYYWECEATEASVLGEGLKEMKSIVAGSVSDCPGKLVRKSIQCINNKCLFLPKKKEKKASLLERLRNLAPSLWRPTVPWGEENRENEQQGQHHQHFRHGPRREEQARLARIEATGQDPEAEKKPNPKELVAGGVFAIPDGDIFSMKKLLRLIGKDLDTTYNEAGEPLRESGTIIEIAAEYNNLHPWISSFGYSPIEYTYKITERPMEEMKTELFAQAQPNFPQERVIEDRHGIYIVVRIGGYFGFFSFVFLLVMLITAAGLIGAATIITEKIALYMLARKKEYREKKYEETEDFPQEHH